MANRSTDFGGGSNWTGEILKSADLNDTFSAVYDKTFRVIEQKTAWVAAGDTISIPANTITVGALILATANYGQTASGVNATLEISTGTSGSEVSRMTSLAGALSGGAQGNIPMMAVYWESTLTWTSAQSVKVSLTSAGGSLTTKNFVVVAM